MDSSELSRGTTLVPVARIGSPLLLKTSLPLPPGCCSTCDGRISLSIAGRIVPGNDSRVRPLQPVPIWIACALVAGPPCSETIDWNNYHNAPAGDTAAAECTSPRSFADAKHSH
jgi:hypothetical protein